MTRHSATFLHADLKCSVSRRCSRFKMVKRCILAASKKLSLCFIIKEKETTKVSKKVQEGFLRCQTPTSAERLEVKGCRVKNGEMRVKNGGCKIKS
jgi:hypothetical protein